MNKPSSKAPNLVRGVKAFVDKLEAQNDPPLYTLTPEEARQVLLGAQSGPIDKPKVEIKDIDLAVGPTGQTSIRILRPPQTGQKMPFIVYFHGGGWVMGNKETHDRLVRELAVGTGSAIVFVDYIPSPESQYPEPVEQAYAVLEHMARNAIQYDLDPTKIVVAGDSVGGNMAIVTSLLAKQRRGPKISFQLLFYPVTDAALDTESYKDFADGPWLTRKAMEWFWDCYLPDKDRRREITASPLRAEAAELLSLPPTLIITAENDVLRDEGEALAKKLDEAGVPTAAVRLNGTIHDFVLLDALAETPPTRAAMALAIAALKAAMS